MVHKIKDKWEKAGVVGVDSAQLLLSDPAYLETEIPSYEAISGLKKHKRVSGDINSATKQILFKLGHKGAGVVVQTGWGDGEYPVYVLKGKTGDEKGRVKAVLVRFI